MGRTGDIRVTKIAIEPVWWLPGVAERLARPSTRITCRLHDECSGSDVFSSDLCTCRPYLAFGVEEAVRQAQQGGLRAVNYNRKEGRAVVKLLVYGARSQAASGTGSSPI